MEGAFMFTYLTSKCSGSAFLSLTFWKKVFMIYVVTGNVYFLI
jgi:hypothetical protein